MTVSIFKDKIDVVSSDIQQLQFIKLHHVTLNYLKPSNDCDFLGLDYLINKLVFMLNYQCNRTLHRPQRPDVAVDVVYVVIESLVSVKAVVLLIFFVQDRNKLMTVMIVWCWLWQ